MWAPSQTLAAGPDRLDRAVEHDLEAGELLVDVVLGLMPHLAAFGLGVLDDPHGPVLGLADDLGPLDHPLGLDSRVADDVRRLPPGGDEQLLVVLEHPAGSPELLGQLVANRFQQVEHLVAGDDRRRRERHRLGGGDDLDELLEEVLDAARLGRIARVALGTFGVVEVGHG